MSKVEELIEEIDKTPIDVMFGASRQRFLKNRLVIIQAEQEALQKRNQFLEYEFLKQDKTIGNMSSTIKKLQEPSVLVEIPEFPQYMVDVFDRCRRVDDPVEHIADLYCKGLNKKVGQYFSLHKSKCYLALLTGNYKAKQQLYMVVFVDSETDRQILFKKGQAYEIDFESNNEGYWEQHFTEEEIKAFDRRSWPFAVEVEGD